MQCQKRAPAQAEAASPRGNRTRVPNCIPDQTPLNWGNQLVPLIVTGLGKWANMGQMHLR